LAGTVYLKLGQSNNALQCLQAVLSAIEAPNDKDPEIATRLKFIHSMTLTALASTLHSKCDDELLEGRFVAARRILTKAMSIAEKLQVEIDKNPTGPMTINLVTNWKLIGDIYSFNYKLKDISSVEGKQNLSLA